MAAGFFAARLAINQQLDWLVDSKRPVVARPDQPLAWLTRLDRRPDLGVVMTKQQVRSAHGRILLVVDAGRMVDSIDAPNLLWVGAIDPTGSSSLMMSTR